MNRTALKKYAPQARLDFIEAVTLRARRLGLDPARPAHVEQIGDVLLIGGQPFPVSIASQRSALVQRIQKHGFAAVVEALAYTWFNRLVAIRFMELKGYLSHGYRVLSHPQGQQPEILDNVQHLDLVGLNKIEVIRLKTAGNQDEALYREILLAQCHELHRNMPFLFEALDDATELLLPDNLLRTDSLIARLVGDIEEDDWQEVEVIGWLYQFYISEKKDEVIGKVVNSEDIPAATQLFTPNWIVQYLVQNSLGRLWLMANPNSTLKERGVMPYYIEPAEQPPEVKAQLDALIKVRLDEDEGTLNPESLTILDPACGSGHILVEAYNLLRAIYEERGYRMRDIPRLILQKNLYGLDIDDRAAQLACFALLMKAREDDHRLFDDNSNPPHLNVMSVQESYGLPDEEISVAIINAAVRVEGGHEFKTAGLFGGGQLETLHSSGLTVRDLRELIQLFTYGKSFGSLISVPATLKSKLSGIIDLLMSVRSQGDDLSRSYADQVLNQFALPASVLALKYDAVVANPPYMGGKNLPAYIKTWAEERFLEGKSDLFGMFILRSIEYAKHGVGFCSLVTMQSWMFISSFLELRKRLISRTFIDSLVQIGFNSFPEMNSKIAQACAFSIVNTRLIGAIGGYVNLNSESKTADKGRIFLRRTDSNVFFRLQDSFEEVPGSPIAYWASDSVRNSWVGTKLINQVSYPKKGLDTGENDRFLRRWYEISRERFTFYNKSDTGSLCWVPLQKGGAFRRWYGNLEYVVYWRDNGSELRKHGGSSIRNERYYGASGCTWSTLTSSDFSMRLCPEGFIFESKGAVCFPRESMKLEELLSFGNSRVAQVFFSALSQTMDYHEGPFGLLPYRTPVEIDELVYSANCAVDISKKDWDESELSWEFSCPYFVGQGAYLNKLSDSWYAWAVESKDRVSRLKVIEEKNNLLFATAFGLQSEVSAEVADSQITLARADRETDMQRLLSYVIGCMMGRYSLDEPGLIAVHSAGGDFNASRYRTFSADSDGILPITDESWFEDDAVERVREFIRVVWGENALAENMEWLADSLNRKPGESADETVRRYLSFSFYRSHLQIYKKRPIYWLFSSGKQKAFECLVYLHRYSEGTLSRMRMEYVVPLQSRMQARIDKLADDINSATGSAQQKALQKRKDKFTKQLEELRRFDETLRPYADQRIALNLDDGVKVNYGKFGDLLAEVKAITGGKED
ncbi:BREX-1 system adenine-specific DNA-methyltransferase PglX [Pseudomonas fluorescens]|nr:BREX-1 system adenine-specific DNA-methyltransferase PglX [Pseudomonas fluorescens]